MPVIKIVMKSRRLHPVHPLAVHRRQTTSARKWRNYFFVRLKRTSRSDLYKNQDGTTNNDVDDDEESPSYGRLEKVVFC